MPHYAISAHSWPDDIPCGSTEMLTKPFWELTYLMVPYKSPHNIEKSLTLWFHTQARTTFMSKIFTLQYYTKSFCQVTHLVVPHTSSDYHYAKRLAVPNNLTQPFWFHTHKPAQPLCQNTHRVVPHTSSHSHSVM